MAASCGKPSKISPDKSSNSRQVNKGNDGESLRSMFQRSDSMANTSTRLVEMLDHIEKRVEILREQASAMEQERECLVSMVKTIQGNQELMVVSEGEREEIQITADRLLGRCLTVEVQVSTPRNEIQKRALDKVNQYIDDLVSRLRHDLEGAKISCQTYLNACLPDARGTIDQRFQSAIIECTADDQKKTRKRLESLLRTIEHAGLNAC